MRSDHESQYESFDWYHTQCDVCNKKIRYESIIISVINEKKMYLCKSCNRDININKIIENGL